MEASAAESSACDLSKQPPTEYLGARGSTRYVTSPRTGTSVCQYFWPAEGKARAIVVIAHGHGGYLCFDWLKNQGPGKLCTYEGSFLQALNRAGFAVAGNDHQGCGRSGGLRCYCDSFDDYVDDVLEVARTCTSSGAPSFAAGLPLYLMGMSKGGCICLLAALKEPSLISGVIALAPMVSLEKVAQSGINPYLRPLGQLLNWLVPKAPLLSTNRNTKFPDLQEMYDMDPNCYHSKTRVRSAQEYLRITQHLVAHQSQLALPLLLFHSEGDTQTDPEGTRRLFEAAQSADKTFVQPPGMWHILMKEPGHEQIEQTVLEWLQKRTQ
ncbi:hypothetical protein HYH03_001666 [Edaphochlamys debaryana]|uniref:Serine aminopeptidase S33 domain-containing protein n=1 Tax=Edaphochlamys debaryana TaxID=47281 RepID=A0A836C6N6_9CHLO|nr:hypothetical protein HYH03_001666 [Edaphochlamys debaryana]|eukprot:KAG2500907.1 hypothetical protein HYH03_001666 [Edaphochlamys debaryana]